MIYGYHRVSHIESTKSGISMDAQRDAILALAATIPDTMGIECHSEKDPQPGFFADHSTSAWKIPFYRRHGGYALLKVLKPGDHVVFYSIDRGFRSTKDFLETVDSWCRQGIFVHFVREQFNTATANGRLLATIIAAFAEWQSHVRSERIKESLAVRKNKPKVEEKPPHNSQLIKPWSGKAIQAIPEKPVEQVTTSRIFSYARRSAINTPENLSLQAQKEIAQRHIPLLQIRYPGAKFIQHFEDAHVSAYSTDLRDRPAGGEMDQMLQSGDLVVVTRLDRAWRRIGDLLNTIYDWHDRGIDVYFCDTGIDTRSAMGQFFLHVLASFAELESSIKSEVTKEALRRLRSMGCINGGQTVMGTKRVEAYSLDGKMRKHEVWDKVSLKRARIWWYLNKKRGWSCDKVRDFWERCMAKREGRKFIPSHGGWVRGKPVRVLWDRKHVWMMIQRYDQLLHRVMDRVRSNRRSNRSKRLKTYRKRGPVGPNGELRLAIRRNATTKQELSKVGVRYIDQQKAEEIRRKTNKSRLLRDRKRESGEAHTGRPLPPRSARRSGGDRP